MIKALFGFKIMFTGNLIVDTLMLYLPAMISNATPVFIKRGKPLDGGKVFIDGRRVFGDGKTVEGLMVGLYFGFITSFSYAIIFGRYILALQLWASSLGALVGDVIGSFIKRRMGIPRGGKALILDQLDFYLGANAFLLITGFKVSIWIFLVGIIIILVLHITSNRIAYMLGLKDVPW